MDGGEAGLVERDRELEGGGTLELATARCNTSITGTLQTAAEGPRAITDSVGQGGEHGGPDCPAHYQ